MEVAQNIFCWLICTCQKYNIKVFLSVAIPTAFCLCFLVSLFHLFLSKQFLIYIHKQVNDIYFGG